MNTPISPKPSTTEEAEKEDQGFHECEVSIYTEASRAEADLQQRLIYCEKNKGHKVFIPAPKFKMDDLPKIHRHANMLSLIIAMINLTVRVCGRYISKRRPQTYTSTGEPYPFCNKGGKKYLRTGTGMVSEVSKYTTEFKRNWNMTDQTCPCKNCKHSPRPMQQWCVFKVITAQHVVFDHDEAKHTKCQLFYDSEDEKDKIQELEGETVESFTNVDYDVCWLYCYTHDMNLGNKLDQMLKVYNNLADKLRNKFRVPSIEAPLTVVVSHPHGCSKQVTVGEVRHIEKVAHGNRTRFTYTAQTCPGSSGAPVFVYGESWWKFLHPHSKRAVEDGLNISGTW